MHFYASKYRGRRNSIVRAPARRGINQRTFDPTAFIGKPIEPIENEEKYIPTNSFADFEIADQLKANITARGFVTPTQIQDQAIPYILRGLDVVGIANTGTGKTAAFLIPLINKTLVDSSQNVLITTPTRELAVQIQDELNEFTKGTPIRSALCIGGVPMYGQIRDLQRNPNFVIGTPGRIMDLVERKILRLGSCSTVVLDEVDRMLDMGFVRDVRQMVSMLPATKHALFFSATLPHNVAEIMSNFSKDPVMISIKTRETPINVTQDIIRTQGKAKIEILHGLLTKDEFKKVLVFGRTKREIEKLSRSLQERGFKAAAIHGNKNQNQRQKALDLFKNNYVQVLLATDVASRGLDIDNVTHVINYDLPESYESYIHRIGRTGRADKSGIALTFVD